MKYEQLHATLDKSLAATSIAERRILTTIATLAAALAVALPIAQFIEIDRLLNPDEPSLWGVIISYTSFWLRVRIAVALAVNAVAILRFRPKPFLVSTFAMVWATTEYVLWFSWSLRVKESLGTGRLPEPSAAGFYGAIWLDTIVLILAMVVLGWMIKTLLPLRTGENQSAEQ